MRNLNLRRSGLILTKIFAVSALLLFYQNCGQEFATILESYDSSSFSKPPVITITEAPASLINVNEASVNFEVQANTFSKIDRILCRLGENEYELCEPPFTVTDLPDGDHILYIQAIDNRGNASPDTIITWRVDATPPNIILSSAPNAVTRDIAANIEFTVSDNLAGVTEIQCSFDGGAFTACTSPVSLQDLIEKTYSFAIRGRDAAGNVSEVSHSWRIDLTVPSITIVNGPTGIVNAATAAFTCSAEDDGVALADFQCALDAGEFAPCTSPMTYNNLNEGNHSFRVRVLDPVTNEYTEPATRMWLVDTVAPQVNISSNVPSTTYSTSVTLTISVVEQGSGILSTECSLDDGGFFPCMNTRMYNNLSLGEHTFTARVTDNANNQTMRSLTWTVMEMPPPQPPPPPVTPPPPPPPSQGVGYVPMLVENFENKQPGQNAFGRMRYDSTYANSGRVSMRSDFTDGQTSYGGTQNLPEGVAPGETLWIRMYLYMPSTLSLSYGDRNGDGFGWNKFIVMSKRNHEPPRMYVQPASSYKADYGDPNFYDTGLYINHDGLGSFCRLQENTYAFPRDKWFALQVSWKVATDSSAHIRVWSDDQFVGECSGAGRVPAGYVVQSFGIGDYWNGGAWIKNGSTASFWIDDIVVTKQTPNTLDSQGRPYIRPTDFR